jgi:hypothetical protein
MAITINGSTNTISGVAVGGLPDGIVDTDMLAANAVTVAKATGSVKGITLVDQWRITSSFSYGNAVTTINANWERTDSDNPGFIGSAMTESSGVFTFPETGIYRIAFKANHTNSSAAASNNAYIYVTTNNSSYSDASISLTRNPSANAYGFTYSEFIFDVEDTSTHKVKFGVYASGANSLVYGHTERHGTAAYFTRLGDT